MRLLSLGSPTDHARCCDLHVAALKSVFPVKEPDLSPLSGGEWEEGEKALHCMFALESCPPAPSSAACVAQWIQCACAFTGVMILLLILLMIVMTIHLAFVALRPRATMLREDVIRGLGL